MGIKLTVSENNKQYAGTEITRYPFEVVVMSNNKNSYLFLKRLIDILISLLGMVLILPLAIAICILIKCEDWNGPVLFKQQRVGKNGQLFYMYKFRSMVCNAESLKLTLLHQNELTGPVFKIKLDPRVTKVGKFMRRTSIDELPQLINVLKGEMSLVGPRPPLPDEVEHYTDYEKQRLSVTPGLTCYWQVSGRNSISFEEWISLDLKYINQQCLWVDMKLIFKTFFVFFGSKDAY